MFNIIMLWPLLVGTLIVVLISIAVYNRRRRDLQTLVTTRKAELADADTTLATAVQAAADAKTALATQRAALRPGSDTARQTVADAIAAERPLLTAHGNALVIRDTRHVQLQSAETALVGVRGNNRVAVQTHRDAVDQAWQSACADFTQAEVNLAPATLTTGNAQRALEVVEANAKTVLTPLEEALQECQTALDAATGCQQGVTTQLEQVQNDLRNAPAPRDGSRRPDPANANNPLPGFWPDVIWPALRDRTLSLVLATLGLVVLMIAGPYAAASYTWLFLLIWLAVLAIPFLVWQQVMSLGAIPILIVATMWQIQGWASCQDIENVQSVVGRTSQNATVYAEVLTDHNAYPLPVENSYQTITTFVGPNHPKANTESDRMGKTILGRRVLISTQYVVAKHADGSYAQGTTQPSWLKDVPANKFDENGTATLSEKHSHDSTRVTQIDETKT